MNIKLKTVGLIAITMFSFIALIFLFLRPVLLSDAREMDQEALDKDRSRAENYLNSTVSDLQFLGRDWAVWNETYSFMQRENPGYVQSNISYETFKNNDINLMIHLNTDLDIFRATGYDLQSGEVWEDNSFGFMNSMLLENLEQSDNGLIINSSMLGPLLLVSEKILASDGQGPPMGYLVMGKVLDHAFFTTMNTQLAIETEVYTNPLEIRKAKMAARQEDEETVSKVVYVGDDIALEVVKDRKYYDEKLRSINDLFIYMAIATLLLAILTYILLNSLVLSRISYLALQLKDVDVSNPETFEVKRLKKADDEITDLENSFQEMIDGLGEANTEITRMAFYDYLTDLPNRLNLFRYFEEEVKNANAYFALLFFDLDGFKRINDLFGHMTGDEVLIQIGKRLALIIDDENIRLFRIGGDEFVILVPYTEKSYLIPMIEQFMVEIRKELTINKVQTSLSSSIGVSLYPSDGTDLSVLMQYADTAMYEAKKAGKNNYFFYEELENKEYYTYNLNLKEGLKNALLNDQLYLEYQPILSADANKIVGVEALVRWNHPEFGIVPPLHFIPLAEESGFIKDIGAWVIRQAVKDVKRWNGDSNDDLFVAVNVSNYQLNFKEELMVTIKGVLEEFDFPPELLHMEITESVLAIKEEGIIEFIRDLKTMNIHVSLDDFGVGASSLFQLIQLDVDRVKIDRSFLQKVPKSPKDTVLLKRIYQTLQDLDIGVVTEGIETAEQLEFVQSESTSQLQGYYFSKPISLDELTVFQNSRLLQLQK